VSAGVVIPSGGRCIELMNPLWAINNMEGLSAYSKKLQRLEKPASLPGAWMHTYFFLLKQQRMSAAKMSCACYTEFHHA
jgi:hypothetical protein